MIDVRTNVEAAWAPSFSPKSAYISMGRKSELN